MSPQQSIAHYRIVSKLGEGGMGAVYRATDTKLNRDVAIKVLPDSFANDPDRLARFTREAQVLASLNHPNIAQIYGVEDRALVMELVEGEELKGPLALETALDYARQIVEALEAAHEKGIVHRDLKPANIKVTADGRVKVLDFGLAKALSGDLAAANPTDSPTLTMRATVAGVILGTAAYMSPEQARGKPVDKRADIWAFGVVLYEMLTGKPLFAGESVSETLAAVLKDDPSLSDAPPSVRPLLERCLQKDPKRRLRDIGDAFLLLGTKTAAPAPKRRSPAMPILLGIASLAACVFAFLWRYGAAAPPQPYRFTLDANGHTLFSPDGRFVVNVNTGLCVRSLENVHWQVLPGTEGASDPFWSPDSSTIGFFSNGRLETIGKDGANFRNLTAVPDPAGGSWRGGTSDGLILYAESGGIETLDLRSGKIRRLPLRFDNGYRPLLPVFCPEGDSFAYLRGTPTGEVSLFRSSVSSTAAEGEHILDTPYSIEFARHPRTGQWHIFFLRADANFGIPNRTLVTAPVDPKTSALLSQPVPVVDAMSNWGGSAYAAFSVASGGILYWRNTSPSLRIWHLRWFDRNGNVTGTVGDAGEYQTLSLSPDERRVAVLKDYPEQHVWVYDFQTGAGERLSSLPGADETPVWSPDGQWIYRISISGDGTRIVRNAVGKANSADVLYRAPDSRRLSIQDITPDGRSLIVREGSGAGGWTLSRFEIAAAQNGQSPESIFPAMHRDANLNARIAPDGRSIVAIAGHAVWASPFPPNGAAPQQIADFKAPAYPFFSRDGRQLYFISGLAVYSYPVEALPGGGIRLGPRSLLFHLNHPTRTLANLGAASRDGSRILAIEGDDPEEARLQVITDWTALLPREHR